MQTNSCLVLGQECTSGDQRPCYEGDTSTRGVGACTLGEQTCEVTGTWGACKNQGKPGVETCEDSVDNDCDGKVNEGCASPAFCKALSLDKLLQLEAVYLSSEPKEAQIELSLTEQGKLRWFSQPKLTILPEPWSITNILWDEKQAANQVTLRLSTTRWVEPLRLQVMGELVFPDNNNLRCAISWTSKPFLLSCNDNLAVCSNQCVDLQRDASHCGSCDAACVSGQACCEGGCVSLSTDTKHCGACGKQCSVGQECCNGTCVSLSSDAKHCGACGKVCGKGQECCQGACADLQTSVNHCGACGVICTGGERCCGGSCVSLSDPKHCGRCGQTCSSLQGCILGECVDCRADVECPPGKLCRQGSCVSCSGTKSDGVGSKPCDRLLSPNKSDTNEFFSVAFDSQGNTYVAGVFSGNIQLGTLSLASKKDDVFVSQWTSQAWGWSKVAGSDVKDSSPSLVFDSQDQLYLAGLFGPNVAVFRDQRPSSQTLLNGSNYSCLAQMNTQGTVSWAKCIGGGRSNTLGGLVVDKQGKWSLAVSMEKASALYCGGQNVLPRDDPQSPYGYFMGVVQGGSNGSCEGGRSAGSELGKGKLIPSAVAYDSTGSTYLAGTFEGVVTWGTTTLSSQGGRDGFVAKLTKDRNLGWIAPLGGSQREEVNGLVVDKAGNIFVAGSFEGVVLLGKTTLTTNLHRDAWVVRLDPKGQFVWAKALGSEQSNEKVGGLALSSDGFLFVAGFFEQRTKLGHVLLTSKGQDDIFVAQLGPWGQVHWVGQAGGQGSERVTSVKVGPQGRVHVLGSTQSSSSTYGSISLPHPNTKLTSHGVLWSFWPYQLSSTE